MLILSNDKRNDALRLDEKTHVEEPLLQQLDSQHGLPRHHARLASDWRPPLAGQEGLPAGSRRRVSEIVATSSPSPFPGLAWRNKI